MKRVSNSKPCHTAGFGLDETGAKRLLWNFVSMLNRWAIPVNDYYLCENNLLLFGHDRHERLFICAQRAEGIRSSSSNSSSRSLRGLATRSFCFIVQLWTRITFQLSRTVVSRQGPSEPFLVRGSCQSTRSRPTSGGWKQPSSLSDSPAVRLGSDKSIEDHSLSGTVTSRQGSVRRVNREGYRDGVKKKKI